MNRKAQESELTLTAADRARNSFAEGTSSPTAILRAAASILLVLSCIVSLLVLPAWAELPAPAPAEPIPLRGLGSPLPEPDKHTLDNIRLDAEESSGAIFEQPDQVLVKPPLLKALIQLDNKLSPYGLDANTKPSRPITLAEVEKIALDNNLVVKISHTDQENYHWQYRGALGGFLPSMSNSISYQALTGKYASPFGLLASVDNINLVMPNSGSYYFFQGGKVLYGALQSKHRYKASQFALKGTTNDILYEAAKLYYDLVLNDVLLQIKVKAVETSQALLARAMIRYDNGAATKLEVLQARTQLSKDRQALISQQIARRQAAIHLSTALNLDTSEDLTVENRLLSKVRLVDSALSAGDLLSIAIDNRPELKHYEQLRLAAKDAVKVAVSALLPTVQGTAVAASTGARVTSSGSGSQSAASTSGFAAGGFSVSGASATPSSGGGSSQPKYAQTEIFVIGVAVEWTLPGLGSIAAANVQSAKWVARKAQLEFNYKLARVYEEVRDAYLESLEAENLIKETTDMVESTKEQLNVAVTRMEEGVGIDVDVINAQRDYTSALVDKASAIAKFDSAQVKLLRTIGKISYDTVARAVPVTNQSK
jgi:outer membrane protein TolC